MLNAQLTESILLQCDGLKVARLSCTGTLENALLDLRIEVAQMRVCLLDEPDGAALEPLKGRKHLRASEDLIPISVKSVVTTLLL